MSRYDIARGCKPPTRTPDEEYTYYMAEYNNAIVGKKKLAKIRSDFLDKFEILHKMCLISDKAFERLRNFLTTAEKDFKGMKLRSGRDIQTLMEQDDSIDNRLSEIELANEKLTPRPEIGGRLPIPGVHI